MTNPYGPYQLPQRQHYGIINRFIMTAIRGGTITLFGGGPQFRDYIHVADATAAILRACVDDRSQGETLNVGSGVSHGLGEVARQIVDLAGSGHIETVPWPEGHWKVEPETSSATQTASNDCSNGERRSHWKTVSVTR